MAGIYRIYLFLQAAGQGSLFSRSWSFYKLYVYGFAMCIGACATILTIYGYPYLTRKWEKSRCFHLPIPQTRMLHRYFAATSIVGITSAYGCNTESAFSKY